MELIAGEGECYGYRKLTSRLRKLWNLVINKKKVYQLCKVINVLRPQRKIKVKHPKLANNRVITGSNQLGYKVWLDFRRKLILLHYVYHRRF